MIQLAKESASAAAAVAAVAATSSSSSSSSTNSNSNNCSNNNSSSGGSNNSSSAALQNLAAARNARGSPAISAGSILQNALSGGRSNPNFAPTLAQLLTNPANEQQQQPQQQPQQQQYTVAPSIPAVSLTVTSTAAAAEVLTLSNLLATAKVSFQDSFSEINSNEINKSIQNSTLDNMERQRATGRTAKCNRNETKSMIFKTTNSRRNARAPSFIVSVSKQLEWYCWWMKLICLFCPLGSRVNFVGSCWT